MLGNVSEWTADWYDAYQAGPVKNSRGPTGGENRAIRGDAWDERFNSFDGVSGSELGQTRLYFNINVIDRLGRAPNQGFETIGFRCVRNP